MNAILEQDQNGFTEFTDWLKTISDINEVPTGIMKNLVI